MAVLTPDKATLGETAAMLGWASRQLGIEFRQPAWAIGILRGEQLAAVAVYHQLRSASIEVSFAAVDPRWATRQVITLLMFWPFNEFPEIRRLTALVKRRNKASRKLVEGIGGNLEGVMLDAYSDDDAVVYGLTRRWWMKSRWYLHRSRVGAKGVRNGRAKLTKDQVLAIRADIRMQEQIARAYNVSTTQKEIARAHKYQSDLSITH